LDLLELERLVSSSYGLEITCPVCGEHGKVSLKRIKRLWEVVLRKPGKKSCHLGTLTDSDLEGICLPELVVLIIQAKNNVALHVVSGKTRAARVLRILDEPDNSAPQNIKIQETEAK
jgi:hypothetical protein